MERNEGNTFEAGSILTTNGIFESVRLFHLKHLNCLFKCYDESIGPQLWWIGRTSVMMNQSDAMQCASPRLFLLKDGVSQKVSFPLKIYIPQHKNKACTFFWKKFFGICENDSHILELSNHDNSPCDYSLQTVGKSLFFSDGIHWKKEYNSFEKNSGFFFQFSKSLML